MLCKYIISLKISYYVVSHLFCFVVFFSWQICLAVRLERSHFCKVTHLDRNRPGCYWVAYCSIFILPYHMTLHSLYDNVLCIYQRREHFHMVFRCMEVYLRCFWCAVMSATYLLHHLILYHEYQGFALLPVVGLRACVVN